jgi:glutamate racemase
MSEKQPLGVFDSGIGGLAVLREIHDLLPAEDLVYFADQAHVPYGSRSLDEVRTLSEEITRFLLQEGSKLIVLACNTASAASLHYLRTIFPQTPFIGMEPAVKPAAEITRSGVVGVLATPATFQGELFASVVDRYAEGIRVLQSTLPGLVEQIESGKLTGEAVEQILQAGIEPLLERGADTLVLGCTHFPFVLPAIEALSGEGVTVIDPSPAIARRAHQVLKTKNALTKDEARSRICYLTSGEAARFEALLDRLQMPAGEVTAVRWADGRLSSVPD